MIFSRLSACAVGACLLMMSICGLRSAAATADPYTVGVWQTSADLTQHLTALPNLEFGSAKVGPLPVITVNAGVRFQTVQGFGASMTDSSAWLIEQQLPAAARTTLLSELFGSSGIRLNFLKVPIGASDFTSTGEPYSYDDLAAGQSDPTLSHFSIAHDQAYILPALRAARVLDPKARFLATPWTPPAWMKRNDSLGNAGDQGTLLTKDMGSYAVYFVKFLQAYAKAGIPIGAVTLQNEPAISTLYPGLNISAASEAKWVVHYLLPALSKAKLHTQIYGNDLGWGSAPYAAGTMNGQAGGALTGLAWHCYYGSPGVMSQFHDADPRLLQIVDECSPGISPTPIPEILISSLRNWATAVALWNLALDPSGGPAELPNHGCEGCQGIVTIDPASGTVALTPTYYQLGQASSFIAPGAQRISSGHFVTYGYTKPGLNIVSPGLDDVALRNPDGSLVLVAYNNATAPITFAVAWRGRALTYQLPAGATATFVWNQTATGGLKRAAGPAAK